MRIASQKRLLAGLLTVFWIGLLFLFYNMLLSLIILASSGVAILVLLTEESGPTIEWWQFVYFKTRGKTRKESEKKKVPRWFIAWWIVWFFLVAFDVYLLYTIPSVGIMFFYVWIGSLFILIYYQFGKDQNESKPVEEV